MRSAKTWSKASCPHMPSPDVLNNSWRDYGNRVGASEFADLVLRDRLPVPVVDGVSSAVRHAETLAALAPTKARAGSFAPPPHKPHLGLPEPIARLLER